MSSRPSVSPAVDPQAAAPQAAPPAGTILAAAVVGLAAAWIAAGSTGLLAHPLRRALTGVALIVAVVLAWPAQARRDADDSLPDTSPKRKRGTSTRVPRLRFGLVCRRALCGLAWPTGRKRVLALTLLALAALAAVPLLSSGLPPLNTLAPALVLLAVAYGHGPRSKLALHLAAEAVVLLAIYRLVCTSIPWVWTVADQVGGVLGGVVAVISHQPLWVGATFAGLDFLVPAVYLAVLVPWRTREASSTRPWYRVAGVYVGAVLLCQLGYLIVLSFGPALLEAEWLQVPRVEPPIAGATPPPPGALARLRLMIPWNMPLLAGLLQLGVASVMLRRIRRLPPAWSPRPAARVAVELAGAAAAILLTVLAAVAVAWFPKAPTLDGKKIVFYEKGFLNWLKPEHGQYGRLMIGMYGMIPPFLESYGARPLISPDLSQADLDGAEAVVLLFPNEPWQEGQLQRLRSFVEHGGTLLLMGEHTIWEKDADGNLLDIAAGRERNRFNEVLADTAIRVNFDSATFAVGGWLHSYEALAHPTTAGLRDEQNEFGVVIGASLDVRFPARPLLIGRYGWGDPGDPSSSRAMMGDDKYTAGDKLGDVILAAEQSCGRGKIVVFGDTSGLTNGLTIGCHEYTSRLYAYLTDGSGGALPAWRLWCGLVVLLGLTALSIARPQPVALAAAAIGLAVSLAACTSITNRAWQYLPDGRYVPGGQPRVPNNLAYIDTSHLGSYSPESWRPEGLMGLAMTLMRDGFLTLHLSEMTAERLERARLLVSVAPAKPFRRDERKMIENFVRNGGIFISTVGYEERGPSRELLADLGFHIGRRPEEELLGRDPQPLGHFKAPFFNGGTYLAYVRFFAAWKVVCDDPSRLPISFSQFGDEVIVMRRVGLGLVVVVGDTFFATNKNLENEGGEPLEGKRENALFWRWLLALLRNGLEEGQPWIPPADECTPIVPAPAAGTGAVSPEPSGAAQPVPESPATESAPAPPDSSAP